MITEIVLDKLATIFFKVGLDKSGDWIEEKISKKEKVPLEEVKK